LAAVCEALNNNTSVVHEGEKLKYQQLALDQIYASAGLEHLRKNYGNS